MTENAKNDQHERRLEFQKVAIPGTRYLRDCLERSGRVLSESLLSSSLLSGGTTYAVVPPDIADKRRMQLETGGIAKYDNACDVLISAIRDLEIDENRFTLVAEDAIGTRETPAPATPPPSVKQFFVEHDVYFWEHASEGSDALQAVIDANSSAICEVYFVSDSSVFRGESLGDAFNMPRDLMKEFVRSIELAIASAYDGESFVVWSRSSSL